MLVYVDDKFSITIHIFMNRYIDDCVICSYYNNNTKHIDMKQWRRESTSLEEIIFYLDMFNIRSGEVCVVFVNHNANPEYRHFFYDNIERFRTSIISPTSEDDKLVHDLYCIKKDD